MLACNPMARTTVTETTDSPRTCQDDALLYGLVLVGSATESNRVGQLAFLWPDEELYVGRGDKGARKFAGFGWHRPGIDFVVLPGQEFLAGDKISRLHLLFLASAGRKGVEMRMLGRRTTFVNGKECGEVTLLQEGDVIHIAGQALFLVVRRPRVLPAPPGIGELHPFGEPDRDRIVGESLRAWKLRVNLDVAASYPTHILVRGETGTGKELAVAAVRTRSDRANGPYVSLNAAAVAPGLIDAELFGVAANLVDGRMAARTGLLADADGGTLFLDELGDCPLDTQIKLLRWLECGEYRRVGETITRRADVRVIGATHKGDDVFREDFRGRFPWEVLLRPLRERQEDIPLLMRQLLVGAVKADPERRERLFFQGPSGRVEPRVSLFFVDHLLRHRLERNTRQLKEILLRALTTSPGDEITLPGLEDAAAERASVAPPASAPMSEKARVKSITKAQVLKALEDCGGVVSQAAKQLGVGRTAMYELMKRHGVKGDRSTA